MECCILIIFCQTKV